MPQIGTLRRGEAMPTTQGKDGNKWPIFMYGTAWKEDRTTQLVQDALAAGFRAFDTANQRKHYFEAGVGKALATFPREQLFIQTKYTFMPGQDNRLPYDPNAAIRDQVAQSFAKSLEHLHTDYLDSYVLHGPSRRAGLIDDDVEAWRAIEELHAQKKVRYIGVSNVSAEQLALLCQLAKVKPHFVQNRCYAITGWDLAVRDICRLNGCTYQGFSLLTANRDIFGSPLMERLVQKYNAPPTRIVFALAFGLGMVPLTGTSNSLHMKDDLLAPQLKLSDADIKELEVAWRQF
jgi:diketogulonate reductase-like aldo/keto reductase